MQKMDKFLYTNFFDDPGILLNHFKEKSYPWEIIKKIDDFFEVFEKDHKKFGYKKLEDRIYVGENVSIEKSAKIDGIAIIGHSSSIGHSAFLRGGVILGDNVHVGHATEVKHSIVLSGTALAHLNYVGDSVMGKNINLSGGATLANWRFDKKDIFVKNGEEKIPTGMEKFGSIVGDDCFIGVNAVLNPGTVLAKGTLVYPLVSVKGSHLEKEIIR